MKITNCDFYIQHDTYDMYGNLMETECCSAKFIDNYNNKTRNYFACDECKCDLKDVYITNNIGFLEVVHE